MDRNCGSEDSCEISEILEVTDLGKTATIKQ